ncbi:MAG: type VI secretion system ATPase TssH, partial [PS1 clade bacterium]
LIQIVSDHFRPEFVNRIDEIVVFNNLKKEQIKGIANLQIDILKKRLIDLGLNLELSDKALEVIIDRGYDPAYGARPLKRVIQQLIENPLSQSILSGDFLPGDTINGHIKNKELVFTS